MEVCKVKHWEVGWNHGIPCLACSFSSQYL